MYQYVNFHGTTVIIMENELGYPNSKTVCISYNTNTSGNGMNQTIFPLAMAK